MGNSSLCRTGIDLQVFRPVFFFVTFGVPFKTILHINAAIVQYSRENKLLSIKGRNSCNLDITPTLNPLFEKYNTANKTKSEWTFNTWLILHGFMKQEAQEGM